MKVKDLVLGGAVTLAGLSGQAAAQTNATQDAAVRPDKTLPADAPPLPQMPGMQIPLSELMSVLPQPPKVVKKPPFPLEGLTLRFDRDALIAHLRTAEGKVLHPYKDTAKLTTIGFGFNMEKQRIEDNAFRFNERTPLNPSGKEVWHLANIPEDYDAILHSVRVKTSPSRRARFSGPPPLEISLQSAEALFQSSVDQAIHNAAAYFRHFNDLEGDKQKALVDLVYNMGTNLPGRHREALDAANQEPADWKTMSNLLYQGGYHHTTRAIEILKTLNSEFSGHVLNAHAKHAGHHEAQAHTTRLTAQHIHHHHKNVRG